MAPSGKLFVRKEGPTWILLSLLPHPSGFESFTFEFGWSRLGRLPEVLAVKCQEPNAEHTEFAAAEYLQRIGKLAQHDVWWEVEEMAESRRRIFDREIPDTLAEARVETAFTPASAYLDEYYLPYLRAFLAEDKSRKVT